MEAAELVEAAPVLVAPVAAQVVGREERHREVPRLHKTAVSEVRSGGRHCHPETVQGADDVAVVHVALAPGDAVSGADLEVEGGRSRRNQEPGLAEVLGSG